MPTYPFGMAEMLKVLVSTTHTQGKVDGDFCFVPEGEIVGRYGIVCDDEREDGVGGCGCGRAFGGFMTLKSTTTAMVVERPMTRKLWRDLALALHERAGYAKAYGPELMETVLDEMMFFDLDKLAEIPIGTILGRRAFNDSSGNMQDEFLQRRF
jgi:hypothetical protein